jgi:hypothetical protein
MHHVLNHKNSAHIFKLSFLLYISTVSSYLHSLYISTVILLPTPKPILFQFLDWYLYVYICQKACCMSNPSHSSYMGKQQKIWTLSLQNSTQLPFTSYSLDPNILLSTWFSNMISLYSSFRITGVKINFCVF